MQEKTLLHMLETQPSAALEEILSVYGGLLHGIAMGILHDERDTEECISDVLVKLWQSREKIREPGRLKSYLCAIARNSALDRLRRRRFVRELELQQELLEDYPVSRQMDRVLLTETVTGAIDALGEPGRTIFLMRYYQETPVREIANHLGLSSWAVESHLYRGRKQLKTLLGGCLDEAETAT